MRILHILSQKEITGAEIYALHLAEEQKRQGHDVQIISDEIHIPTSVHFESWSVHNPSFWEHRANVRKLKAKILKENIQIVHGHSRAAVRLAYPACQATPAAQITSMHGRQHSSWSKRLFDIYGDRVIAICENVADHLQSEFGMNPRKIFVIRNPFDFKNPTLKKEVSDLKIALIGRTTGPKGQQTRDLLIHVFPKVLKKFPKVHLDIVGRPIEALGPEALKQIAQLKSDFGDRVQTIGNLKRLHDYWPQSDIVIGAGRVAVESLIEGKTVLALGEAQWEGLVTPDSWARVIQSNFGDIGYPNKSTPLPLDQIEKEIERILSEPRPDKMNSEVLSLAALDFESSKVLAKIERLYESAFWQKQKPQFVPILMYHKVVPQEIQSQHKIFITQDNFEKHLRFFKSEGFTTLTFQDLSAFRKGIKPLSEFPKKPLILSFDDGYKNNLDLAVPLLQKYGSTAVFFLLANLDLKTNAWDHEQMPLMTRAERKSLANLGFEIGSHGFSHQKISTLTEEQARLELLESKKSLEKELRIPIITYAFTYGDTTATSARLAQEAQYEYAVNTDQGGLHHEEDPYKIFRVNIFPNDGPAQLKKKTSSWYRRYYFLKRKK